MWMPIMIKYGRRPLYIFTFAMYTACAGWAGAPTSYGSALAAGFSWVLRAVRPSALLR